MGDFQVCISVPLRWFRPKKNPTNDFPQIKTIVEDNFKPIIDATTCKIINNISFLLAINLKNLTLGPFGGLFAFKTLIHEFCQNNFA